MIARCRSILTLLTKWSPVTVYTDSDSVSAPCRLRSQSLNRIRPTVGRVPCVTPNARIWLRRRRRLLLGDEALCLQGLEIGKIRYVLESMPEQAKSTLAGNSFNFHCYAVGMVAALSSIPIAWLE